MIIAIDVRPLLGGNTSGVEVYIRHLLKHLLQHNKENRFILYLNGAKREDHLLSSLREEGVSVVHTRYPNKIFNALLTFFRWPKLDRLIEKKTGMHPDVFFAPDLRPSPVSKDTKKITVIHDLSFLHFPHFFSARTRLWYALINPERELRESSSLIAVSEFTRQDVIKQYGIEPVKITMVHEGVEANFCRNVSEENKEKIRQKYHLPEKFFLYLATIEPRKNIPALIESFQQFKRNTGKNIGLVIAGKPNRRIFSGMPSYRDKDIHFPGFIDEEDKPVLYSMATAFMYPSIFEGFGLPLLEAMKCQTSIITSNTSSIPEVVGDAALLINPERPAEIAQAMEKILDPRISKKLREKMKKQIKNFSWEKSAAETLIAIYLSS